MKGWRPFEEAKEVARSLKLKSWVEWEQYCKFGKDGIPKPNDIPDAPGRFYKKNNGWKGMGDWLGNEDKVISDEARRKMSETKNRMYADGYVAGMKGKKHSEETRKVIKEERWKQVFPVKDSKFELSIQALLR